MSASDPRAAAGETSTPERLHPETPDTRQPEAPDTLQPEADPEEKPLDARLLLPAAAGWITAILLMPHSSIVAVITAATATAITLTLLTLALRRRSRLLFTLVAITSLSAGLAAASALQIHRLTTGPIPALATTHSTAKLHLKITSDPAVRSTPGNRRPPYVVLKATAEQVTARGTATRVRTPILLIGSPAWQHVRLGQLVETSGRLSAVDPGSDVAAMVSARASPKILGDPAWWLRAAEQVRAGLRDSVADQPDDVRGLVPALVMGDESALPPDLVTDFQLTGLTHLSAVSGTNLTLLLAFVLPLARLLGVRARGLTVVGLLMVVAFVILARPQPSVLRAAAMGLVALAAMTTGGSRRRAVRSLSVAVIALLLLDTSLARSAGFALSVLATAGIVLLGPAWRDALATWMPLRLAEAISCPLAAQLACTPVVAWLSGQVSLVAVAANLLAGPAVGPATILGFGAAGIALLSSDLARLAGWLASWPARWIILVAETGADLPGAVSPWPATVVGVTILTLLCLALTVGLHRILTRPLAVLLCLAVLVFVVLRPTPRLGWPPANWILVACDVGQGDGLVLRTGPRSAVVVDTGPDPTPMDRCLQDLGITHIPVLVLTHFHADHAGGLAGALHDRQVDEIEVTPYFSPPAEFRRVQALASTHQIPVRPVTYKERRTIGPLTWTTLWPAQVPSLPTDPSATNDDESSPENNASIVMLAETTGLRILLTGDLEPEAQRSVLAAHPDLRADILKVPHHGSARQDPTFFATAQPRLALISAGPDNDYGHPAPRTLDLLTRTGTTIRRTDTSGAIAITSENNKLATTSQGRSP